MLLKATKSTSSFFIYFFKLVESVFLYGKIPIMLDKPFLFIFFKLVYQNLLVLGLSSIKIFLNLHTLLYTLKFSSFKAQMTSPNGSPLSFFASFKRDLKLSYTTPHTLQRNTGKQREPSVIGIRAVKVQIRIAAIITAHVIAAQGRRRSKIPETRKWIS